MSLHQDSLPPSPPLSSHHPAHPLIQLRKHKYNSLDSLKSTYRSAAKAFLHNDHASVWLAIAHGLQSTALLLHSSSQSIDRPSLPSWLPRSPSYPALDLIGSPSHSPRPIDDRIDEELRELERKFHVLRITFVASLSSPAALATVRVLAAQHSGHARTLLEALVGLIARPPGLLLATLWALASAPSDALEAVLASEPPPPMASPTLVGLHPSVVVAAALAALKLGVPSAGRSICEAWLASLTDGALDALALALSVPGSQTTMRIASQARGRPPTDVRAAYEGLIEVYAVHVLGALEEWDFAAGFLAGQSRELGGPLSVSTVERLADALRAQQAHHAHTLQVALQRHQRRLDLARLQRAASVTPKPAPGRTSAPARQRSPPSAPARQPSSAARPHVDQCSPAGFSALRANLSRLVSTETTHPATPSRTHTPGIVELLKLNILNIVRSVLGARVAQRVHETRLLVIGLLGILLVVKTLRKRIGVTNRLTTNDRLGGVGVGVVVVAQKFYKKILQTVLMGIKFSHL